MPQLSHFMEPTFFLHVRGCHCTHHFRKILCFAPSLQWSLSRGPAQLPALGSCWGITLRRKWLSGLSMALFSRVFGFGSGLMDSMIGDG